jgi:hypothetical protein
VIRRRFAVTRATIGAACLVAIASCGPSSCGGAAAAPVAAGDDGGGAAVDPARACGQPGPVPTPLPKILTDGGERVGRATIAAGQKAAIGSISLEYDPDAWIGTMEVGARGPALAALIDRAEAGGGPWGSQQQLYPGAAFAFGIGPYAFAGRAAKGEPPASIDVSVVRNSCPRSEVVDALTAPMWTWLSTGAIQLVSFRPDTDMAQIAIAAQPTAPGVRVDFSTLAYRRWFVPEPGRAVRVQGPGYLFALESAVPGRATRFADGAWRADPLPEAHALVRIEPRDGAPFDRDRMPAVASACGEPIAGWAPLPAALAAPLSKPVDVALAVGATVERDGLTLALSETTLPARHFDPPETYRDLALRTADGALQRNVSLGGFGARCVRLGAHVIRIDPGSVGPNLQGELRAAIARVGCVATAEAAIPAAPSTLWLSTRGLESVVLGPPGSAELVSLTLSVTDAEISLSVSAPDGYYSCRIRPDAAGRVFELGGARFEIAAVEASGDTRFDGERWTSAELLPAVHVAIIAAKAP